ncbi:LOW QUALITY PROTEIN: RNA exonuclease 1 homolog [Heteronotia binoei]|uniref:LOW QUALITY PROTEIN: RNA exonuclease 1 homolog n=1 Tax=Heteronotia binoei TaxID=13085 RepID=UPI00292DC126|nr:LOW QUALITY PROTEIN: RNA exonuclease 1 homolog [Heteronotia binoei]
MLRSKGFFRGVECPFGPACGRPYCHFRHPPGATDAALPARRPSGQAGPSGRPSASESSLAVSLLYSDPAEIPKSAEIGLYRTDFLPGAKLQSIKTMQLDSTRQPMNCAVGTRAVTAGHCDILTGRGARRAPGGMLERGRGGSMNKYLRCLLTRESTECGYDPYNPELPNPSGQSRNGSLEDVTDPAPSILELELVNQAIEAVRNEVEREQKKYEELLETTKEYATSEPPSLVSGATGPASVTKANSFTSLEYNPGSYSASSTDYNPTPLAAASTSRSSKYTLDFPGSAKSKGSSLEYVPTVVTQPKKYSHSFANSKYIIDKSKPSTDLEYDPLSNYSARLLGKASAKEPKGTKRNRAVDHGDAYSPLLKKHCDAAASPSPVAKFSDSEDDQDLGGEAAPAGRSKPKGSSDSKGSDLPVTEAKGIQQDELRSRQMKETAVQYDMEDIESAQGTIVGDALQKEAKLAKVLSNRNEKGKGKNKEVTKDKVKEKNAEGKKAEGRAADKEKTGTKEHRRNGERSEKKRDKPHTGGSLKTPDKLKTGKGTCGKQEISGKNKKEGHSKASSSEKVKSPKKDSKLRPVNAAGKKEAREAKRKDGKAKPLTSEPPKAKPADSQRKGSAKGECRAKQRTLSHADLFGDESGDEGPLAQPPPVVFPSVSSDSDGDDGGSPLPCYNGVPSLKRPKLSKEPPPSPSSSSSDDVAYSVLEKDLDFESDPMEECLRIFNESTDVKTEDKGRLGKQPSREEETEEKVGEDGLTTLFPGQKRRISHVTKQGSAEVPSKPAVRPYRPPTAQEVCYQRIRLAQQQAAQLALHSTVLAAAAPPRSSPALHKGEKKRIAHVPSSAALPVATSCTPGGPQRAVPPRSMASSNGTDALSLKARTLAGMASKTTNTNVPKRIAHAPSLQSATLKRPVIPTEFGAKVPTNIRQRYLHLFIDECLKICSSQQEAFDKALSEEKVAYKRSTSRNIYLNVAVNTLKKLRSLLPGPSQGANKPSNRKMVSHEAMLGGKLATKISFSLNRSTSLQAEDLTGAALYRRLKEYLMTEEQLKENSYPMPCPEKPGRAIVFTVEEKKTADSSCRVCCRCGTEYMVTPAGNCVRKEECVHHWGRLRKQRVPGGWETHYSCCSGVVGSPGCQVAKQHVHDGRKENLTGFVKTFEKLPNAEGYPGIYALDCEMCFTKQGLEPPGVTVINSELKVVYDTFVKPDRKVVDYNTRFSGVTEADLENTTITLRDVQAVLLNMFSADTILIGHSLESDLFALKLLHSTVVDTAVVFPHRLGLPYKRALRTLMADHLKRIIQDSVEGHDSSEDAGACMELMIWKIKEDAKVKR